ncbi:hypothetical protein LTR56_028095 [Elasticomyces elasticus]|nr:hypothetical protein LTR56_028095 [Elasticomyces elasticus]
MAIFSNFFKFGTSSSRITVPSHDDDGNPDDHVRKALLEGEDDDGGTDSPPPYSSKHRRAIGCTGFAAGIAASALVFGLLTLCLSWHVATLETGCARTEVQDVRHSGNTTEGTPNLENDPNIVVTEPDVSIFAGWKDCGSNVEEARARGCFFDVMLHSWVHEDCFDKALMDDYLTKVPYHWYRDWKLKDEITVEEMRLGEHETAAVNLEEHGTHCAYVLEKNLRASMNGRSMARSIYSVKHAVHCIGLIVDPSTIPGDYTQVVVEYDQCGVPHFG